MIAYLDSSVVLRVILGQRDKLRGWKSIERGVARTPVQVECLRTLDRFRLRAGLSDEDLAARRQTVFQINDETEIVETQANDPVER